MESQPGREPRDWETLRRWDPERIGPYVVLGRLGSGSMGQVYLGRSAAGRLVEEFGYGWTDIEWLTVNAMKSAFAGFDERLRLINTVIKPGFATARAISDAVVPVGLLGGQPSD